MVETGGLEKRPQIGRPGAVVGCFELFRVMQLVPQDFHDQTKQRICKGIRR